MLKKCAKDGTDVYLALLYYRNSSRDADLKSPNQRLFSRNTRSTIPTTFKSLVPEVISSVTVKLEKLRNKSKTYADKCSKEPESFEPGDKVRMQTGHRQWISGEIKEKLQAPRSYMVKASNGRLFRRNTSHLSKCNAQIPSERTVVCSQQQTDMQNTAIGTKVIGQESNNVDEQPNFGNEIQLEETNSSPKVVVKSRYGRTIKPVNRLIAQE